MRVAINRFEPFRELAAVQARLNRIFSEPYEHGDDTLTRADWVPAVDVFETEQHELVVKAELAGIKREDIDLKVENNILTIRGERKRDQEIKQDAYQRVERTYGAFARSFTLPTTVNPDAVKAEFKDGVLTVVLPAKEEAKPRQVQIAIN
ncbi:MAG: Hsp20/alpha crystallin family protein [Vicinamibacteraceae bacterium]